MSREYNEIISYDKVLYFKYIKNKNKMFLKQNIHYKDSHIKKFCSFRHYI